MANIADKELRLKSLVLTVNDWKLMYEIYCNWFNEEDWDKNGNLVNEYYEGIRKELEKVTR